MNNMDEELLTRALDRAARRIRPESLRVLTEPAERPGSRRTRWAGWLAPAAAAAAVVLVAGAVVTVSSWQQARHAAGGGPRSGSRAATLPNGLPAYYAEVELVDQGHGSRIMVRSTATGGIAAAVASPAGLDPMSVAVAPDDQTFYALYGKSGELLAYTFRMLPSGAATAPVKVKGALITGQSGYVNLGGFAVSPDGSRLAIGVADPAVSSGPASVAGEILVIDLRTGGHTTWAGGMDRQGQRFSIASLSWTGDGRSLVYLAHWCPSSAAENASAGAFCGVGANSTGSGADSQVREIDATSDGGSLSSGPVLLRQSARYQYIAQALSDPASRDIIAAVQEGQSVAVVRIAMATGQTVSVLYRQRYDFPIATAQYYQLAVDRGHLLYAWGGGMRPVHGWIQDGTLHELAPVLRNPNPTVGWMQPVW